MNITETFDKDKNLADLIEEYLKKMLEVSKQWWEYDIIILLIQVIHIGRSSKCITI